MVALGESRRFNDGKGSIERAFVHMPYYQDAYEK
jgi:hypothetical protein